MNAVLNRRDEISQQEVQHDGRTVLLVRAPGGTGRDQQLRRQLHDTICDDLLEARWHKMLADLPRLERRVRCDNHEWTLAEYLTR